MNYSKKSLELHQQKKGKLAIKSKISLENKTDLSIAYTPGVAEPCRKIFKRPAEAYKYTIKGNSVAVVTNGSAVLGLGNIGPLAALPVMEGKCLLFKKFADIDAYPICLDTQDKQEIIKAVKLIAPGFGGINLEDIKAPDCFEIEEQLTKELDIPVFHDDQHGTAIVVLAALINSLKIVKKKINQIKILVNGAGAAGIATTKLLLAAGVKNIILIDSAGAIYSGRKNLNPAKKQIARLTNLKKQKGRIEHLIKGTDVFIGISVAKVLKPRWASLMADQSIVFAMANPIPEIMPDQAKKAGVKIMATGRSDFPNQINNVLAFPGIFRGLLDAKAKKVTMRMKLAAAKSLASIVKKPTPHKIVPNVFNKQVVKKIAGTIKQCIN
ncbi:MAG: NAD-dependent malic enzyme [Parcubacteria group bacterium]|jgi:malate dehydrogenase (oxaloacetate-decarboxylating)|nr:NAD-dependent malic enzyme [Parcubacteria group bacterium]|tara:strand:+ start:692 stop:1837 length:1146 start_codon:yes stop_codon:yes gene_type:complete